jgi:methionine synthase II (cobalamin-independent)
VLGAPPNIRRHEALRSGAMFATLLGGLPRPPLPDGVEARSDRAIDVLIKLALRAQEEAGLEPITDGRLRNAAFDPVDAWRFAAGLTDRAVKQALPGPFTLGRAAAGPSGRAEEPAPRRRGSAGRAWRGRERRTMIIADGLRRQIDALVAAGCPLIEIEEAEAHLIGEAEGERQLFRDAHQRLTQGVTGTHMSLSIVGGSAARAGIETIAAASYASFAFDLIAGSDNWNLVTRLPGDRGVVVGALSAKPDDEPKEVLLWGAQYAASTAGRGIARVGLGSAGSWANLSWVAALRKLQALGAAAHLAALPPGEELAQSVDPGSLSSRQAALGPARAGHDHGHRPSRR